ncbi:hypothetical protein [Dermacoccus nishinomiyaensis]|uniref:hypothetical protein n=1 Tax=Dermacoccus nishinomiyaensis TaxID=1274 RepID=UPI00248DD4F9|nr:hypothetical protein [Dermacoccus nishinomiyaensis]
MYQGPFVQTGLVRKTTTASAFATPLAWGHWIVAIAALSALLSAYMLWARALLKRRGEWK